MRIYGIITAVETLAIATFAMPAASAAGRPDFSYRPLLAGKASLTEGGFVEARSLGTVAFAPELALPVELVYRSASESSGAFGYGWSCPQLESSVKWDKDGLLWTAPWGERIKFFPKKSKTPRDAVKIAPVEAAKKGRGLFAPYSEWESDAPTADYASSRDFTITGKDDLKGWAFSYSRGALVRITSPHGTEVLFERGADGLLLAVSSRGVRFVELAHAGGRVSSMGVNGVPVSFSYAKGNVDVLPKTLDGKASTATVDFLSSLRIASLEPEKFTYAKGYLASATRGERTERFAVQTETPAERRQNLKSAEPKSKVAHTGKIAGRLVADADFSYSYPSKSSVKLVNAAKDAATYDYDARNGVFKVCDFSGRTTTTYYFMRYDAAYLGKVRKVVDGRGRDMAAFRYDKATGKPVRVTDRLGNNRYLEYDDNGNCTKLTRRADWTLTREPVRSFAYDRLGRLSAVSELDEDGKPVQTISFARDKAGRVTKLADGRRTVKIAYSASGFPCEIRDDSGVVATLAYDRYNRLVSSADAYGVATARTYADHGGVAKIVRRDGGEVLSSIEIGYDKLGLPVSATDQDGLATACDRDALGRIVKERYANETEVAYSYDKIGRLASVIDENGNEIKFGWDRFGLSSRLTAAKQLTDVKRDANGLVASVSASQSGRTGRVIRREYDGFDRVTKIEYAKNEVETFAYDSWGRVAEHTRGRLKETYSYDHFGRLAEKAEGAVKYTYEYNAYGQRTSRKVTDSSGETTEERRIYDRYGRLTEISSFGKSVKYAYDAKGRVSRQTVDGTPIDYVYTKYGQLAGKYLGGKQNPEASVEYEYSKSGQIVARTANGARQTYEYDKKGQLLAVKDAGGNAVERYAYDKAGNMVRKTVGGKTTTFTFDRANQLVSSTTDGVTTKYAYDAAGRLVKEGGRTYRYGYLDKVMSVTENDTTRTYTYHADGQLATANYGDSSESFSWDGLALIQRGDEQFINEPHVGGGNPVVSSKGTSYFNDMLGTTLGAKTKGKKYSAAALTAFGEGADADKTFFTGKPYVEGLGHAFLFRNYRASLAKWQTADPMGYPDGWNQLADCNNGVTSAVDLWGCERNVGDIEYIDMNPDEYFALLGLGGKALPLEREGFDSEWLGAGRSHIEIQGSRHSAVANGIETTWAMFADYENFARWSVYFVSVEFTAENFRSRLCSLAASGGKITDAICKVLLVFGVPASVEVKVGAKISSIIGSLEDLMKDRVTIGLGRYKVCDELYERCCRKHEEIVSVAFIKE